MIEHVVILNILRRVVVVVVNFRFGLNCRQLMSVFLNEGGQFCFILLYAKVIPSSVCSFKIKNKKIILRLQTFSDFRGLLRRGPSDNCLVSLPHTCFWT